MNQVEHLTENQLTDYFGNPTLDREAKHHIGRHLLQCDFCLNRLPQPTTEHFWTALMTEEYPKDSRREKTVLAARLNLIFESLLQPKVFAVGAATLTILIICSAFIWLNAAKSSEMEKVVAENFETAPPVFNQTGNEQTKSSPTFPTAENGNQSPRVAASKSGADKAAAARNAAKSSLKIEPRTDFTPKNSSKPAGVEKVIISNTRGGSAPLPKCSEIALEMTTGSKDEAITLKWKKVSKAAKYHLYVSDDDEILIDEFETERETSYVLKKPLDPAKTYQWRVVITLADGNTVIGDSQKFTVKDFGTRKSEKKEKSQVRCLQQN